MPWPAWHLHLDVWGLVVALGLAYWYAERRLRPLVAPQAHPATVGQAWRWYGGLALLAAVSSWPFHDIGETALFSVHMIEHMVLVLVVPPLLLAGIPRWIADRTLGHPGVARVLRPAARAVPAFAIFNVVLVAIHWPLVVELMLTSTIGHFTVHALLFGAALLTWLPVVSPTPAIPRLGAPLQMLYLFLHSLIPTVPASFLTFSYAPIYPVYGDAALAWGITAVTDQTVAGLIMKLGGGLLLWGRIALIWFRWYGEERRWDRLERELRAVE